MPSRQAKPLPLLVLLLIITSINPLHWFCSMCEVLSLDPSLITIISFFIFFIFLIFFKIFLIYFSSLKTGIITDKSIL